MQLPFTITDAAIDELKHIKDNSKIPDGYFVRVMCKSMSCAGTDYAIGFDAPADDDHLINAHGLVFLVSKKDFMMLLDIEVDYASLDNEEGFHFIK